MASGQLIRSLVGRDMVETSDPCAGCHCRPYLSISGRKWLYRYHGEQALVCSCGCSDVARRRQEEAS